MHPYRIQHTSEERLSLFRLYFAAMAAVPDLQAARLRAEAMVEADLEFVRKDALERMAAHLAEQVPAAVRDFLEHSPANPSATDEHFYFSLNWDRDAEGGEGTTRLALGFDPDVPRDLRAELEGHVLDALDAAGRTCALCDGEDMETVGGPMVVAAVVHPPEAVAAPKPGGAA